VGDRVEILVGPDRVRIVPVLEPMNGRGVVRVDLGGRVHSKRKGTFLSGDTFEETQLLSAVSAEQRLAAYAPQAARS
jgi:hypothetical protein